MHFVWISWAALLSPSEVLAHGLPRAGLYAEAQVEVIILHLCFFAEKLVNDAIIHSPHPLPPGPVLTCKHCWFCGSCLSGWVDPLLPLHDCCPGEPVVLPLDDCSSFSTEFSLQPPLPCCAFVYRTQIFPSKFSFSVSLLWNIQWLPLTSKLWVQQASASI